MALARFQNLRRAVLAVIISLTLLLLLVVRSSADGEFHEYVEAAGLALIAIGIVGRMWCTLYIGGRKSSEIISKGPYSISRNPLYVFSAIAAAGVGAQTGSLVIAVAVMVGCAGLFQVVIWREEQFLSMKFGQPYEAYTLAVPRFWPALSKFSDAPTLTVSTRLVYRTLADGLIFFAAAPVLELVEELQKSGVLPVLFRLP